MRFLPNCWLLAGLLLLRAAAAAASASAVAPAPAASTAAFAPALPAAHRAAPAARPPELAGLYRPGLRLLLDTRREADSLRLYLRLPEARALGPGRPLRLAAWAAYEARTALWQDSIPARRQHRQPDGAGGLRVSFCLPLARVPAGTVLQVQAGEPSREGYQAAATATWLRLSPERLARPFILTDSARQPLLRAYALAGEAFGIESFGLYQPLRWRRYEAPATPAPPPFAKPGAGTGGPRRLALTDSGTVAAGQALRFGQAGLYALRVGGLGGVPVSTLAVLVAAGRYPALSTAAELLEPLRYLTTSKERAALAAAPDLKRAVDKFWLGIAQGDQARARNLIRSYYGRVTAANDLFAAHKAGYLTDRGLLYVVLGPPPSVRRLPDGEERWLYPEGDEGAPISFSFRPRPSTFAPDNYELVRNPEYELPWYAAVQAWRTSVAR